MTIKTVIIYLNNKKNNLLLCAAASQVVKAQCVVLLKSKTLIFSYRLRGYHDAANQQHK